MNGIEAALPKSIEQSKLLIGEGVEEELWFSSLLDHLQISGVQIEQYNGKSGLRRYLEALKNRPGFSALKALGVTRDANSDPAAAGSSVADVIRNAHLPTELTVRWFVLPWADRPGALEDLCLNTMSGSPLEGCLDEYFAAIASLIEVLKIMEGAGSAIC